jgi:hypothetical protein
MATNILSIPAMSADSEQLFSRSKLTLEDLRNRIGPELLEALEFLKSWNMIKEFDMLQPGAVFGSGRAHLLNCLVNGLQCQSRNSYLFCSLWK